jgi:hypothetical protein
MKKPRGNMIKDFKQDTKEVLMMIKNNTNSIIIRWLLYIILFIVIPILFIIDFIRWSLNI